MYLNPQLLAQFFTRRCSQILALFYILKLLKVVFSLSCPSWSENLYFALYLLGLGQLMAVTSHSNLLGQPGKLLNSVGLSTDFGLSELKHVCLLSIKISFMVLGPCMQLTEALKSHLFSSSPLLLPQLPA